MSEWDGRGERRAAPPPRPPARTLLPLDQQLQSSKGTGGGSSSLPTWSPRLGVGRRVGWCNLGHSGHKLVLEPARSPPAALGWEGQKSRLCPLPIPCRPPQDQGQRLVILHKVQASVRSGLFKANSSHTAPEMRGGSAWQLLSCISPHLM